MTFSRLLVIAAYIGGILMILSAFLSWQVALRPVFEDQVLIFWLKRVTIGTLGAASFYINYLVYKYRNRQHALFNTFLGIATFLIAVTAFVKPEYEDLIQNGAGYYMALVGTLLVFISSLILYFTTPKRLVP